MPIYVCIYCRRSDGGCPESVIIRIKITGVNAKNGVASKSYGPGWKESLAHRTPTRRRKGNIVNERIQAIPLKSGYGPADARMKGNKRTPLKEAGHPKTQSGNFGQPLWICSSRTMHGKTKEPVIAGNELLPL